MTGDVPRQDPNKGSHLDKGRPGHVQRDLGARSEGHLADGKTFLLAGELAALAPNRLNLYDLETRKPTLDIMDLPTSTMPSWSVMSSI